MTVGFEKRVRLVGAMRAPGLDGVTKREVGRRLCSFMGGKQGATELVRRHQLHLAGRPAEIQRLDREHNRDRRWGLLILGLGGDWMGGRAVLR